MPQYEQQPGDIIIFKNRGKNGQQLHPKAPQYTGNGLDLNGNPIRISLWVKDGANGKFFAGRMEPPYEGGRQQGGSSRSGGQRQNAQQNTSVTEDDIPW